MATSIIDALVVTLNLDNKGYLKGRQEVSKGLKQTRDESIKTAKVMEAQGKRAAGFFSSIKNELLAFVGVSLTTAGITGFVKNTSTGLQQIAIQSQALGMSSRQLDGWSKAAQNAGSSAEKITGTLGTLQNALQNYQTMGDASSPIFKALSMLTGDTGVTFDPSKQDADGLMRSALDALRKERNPGRARQIALMLGIDDATFQSNQRGDFTRDVAKYTRRSKISDKDIANAQKFNQQWADLQQRLESVGYVFYDKLSPHINELLGYLLRLSDWLENNPDEIEKSLHAFFSNISDITKECDEAAQAVGGWKNVIAALVGIKVVSWVTGFSGALMKLAPAMAAAAIAVKGLSNIADINQEAKKRGVSPADVIHERMKAKDKDGEDFTDSLIEKFKSLFGIEDSKSAIEKSAQQRDKTNFLLDGVKSAVGNLVNVIIPSAHAEEAVNGPFPMANAPKAVGKGKALLDNLSDFFVGIERRNGLPAGLLRSVATVESGGNPLAISKVGAKGMFQLMDGTAKDLNLRGNDVFDPRKAAQAAGQYLSQLLKQTGGDLNSALAAYNWGIGNVKKRGLSKAPLETRQYVPKVLAGIRPGAGMSVDSRPQQTQVAQTSPQYNINNVNVQSNASRVDQLTVDIERSAQNRTRALGFTGGQA